MELQRSAGILLHPVSLPGSPGTGEIGRHAYRFVDFLAESGATLWQILPLGPTGHGNSPYTAISSFGGNPLLIALDLLEQRGLLPAGTVDDHPDFPVDRIDYDRVIAWKEPLLRQAARTYLASPAMAEGRAIRWNDATGGDKGAAGTGGAAGKAPDFDEFCSREAYWLEDYALFVAAKRHFDAQAAAEGAAAAGRAAADETGGEAQQAPDSRWNLYWPKKLALRDPDGLEKWRIFFAEEIEIEKVLQYFFFTQWAELKRYANARGIRLFGDIPIFVAPDSADVWSRPELFLLDEENTPQAVSGVPPDYFSSTGQRWGNPLYDWERHEREDFAWWISRLRKTFELVDIVRIDHFRGFEAYWEIPADSETAVVGRWVKAPGRRFFSRLREELGELPVVAENLGVITPEVEALRRDFGLPGMLVLQFAFDPDGKGGLDTENPFLPHNHTVDAVAYTGTHDNDTSRGWYESRSEDERDVIRRYLGRPDGEVVWELIREVFRSVSRYAVVPMQDPLELGSESRMNTPSTVGSNWSWRMRTEHMEPGVAARLRELARLYGRLHGRRPS